MAKCVRCGAETALYLLGRPICTDCDSGAVRKPPPKKQKQDSRDDPKKREPERQQPSS
jgi:hypothetical protein